MKVQGNRYINNPEMIKNKVEKKTTVPQNIISEDDVKISDSARKLRLLVIRYRIFIQCIFHLLMER